MAFNEELQRENKLISYQRALKMLENDIRDLKQTDSAAERRRSHSNLYSI